MLMKFSSTLTQLLLVQHWEKRSRREEAEDEQRQLEGWKERKVGGEVKKFGRDQGRR